MKIRSLFLIAFLITAFNACKPGRKSTNQNDFFLSAKEVIRLNQLIYKDSINETFLKYAPEYEVVFLPKPVNGNYAVIVNKKETQQYALVIRGSVIEFSNEGFQNFILQDFNIFKIKQWDYTDSVKQAYISNGAWIGFQNLLQLKDIQTGLRLIDFIDQKISKDGKLVITGHSLGGNLAYPIAGYLKKELTEDRKNNLQLITFGAPAVGNAAFVQDMEEKFPDAERYAGSKDIACMFPDLGKIAKLSKAIGLDSVLQLGKLNVYGFSSNDILDMANVILEKTKVINETNRYVQSEKHLRLLPEKDLSTSGIKLSADAIFNRAYQCHKVDMYAELLGVSLIPE